MNIFDLILFIYSHHVILRPHLVLMRIGQYIYLHKAVELTPPRMRGWESKCVFVISRDVGKNVKSNTLSKVEESDLSRAERCSLLSRHVH